MDAAARALGARLQQAGFVAGDEEARELIAAAGADAALLEELVARRLTGEPLAWIVGCVDFAGVAIRVEPGVYVPRPQTELVAERAAARLAPGGVGIDLCTGSGAVAALLSVRAPGARVVASDLDPRAVACARRNGVEAYEGDLFDPLPRELAGRVDVVAGVVPYVPRDDLPLLQRDTFAFESALSYDGGPDGADVLRRAIAGSPVWMRPGAALVLELGGDEAALVASDLRACGFGDAEVIRDEDGDVRGLAATWSG